MILTTAALNLSVALACGAVIGSERQVRQRMAGLRTNALVALGAAAFVTFSQLVPNEVSPTRVAAQVVSGIGFLGAGIIFREGFNIHGLNTAATLWCSAAIGLICGIGQWPFALLVSGLVIFINLGLRPLVKLLKRHTRAGISVSRHFRLEVEIRQDDQAEVRLRLIQVLADLGLRLGGIDYANSADGRSQLILDLEALDTADSLDPLIARLAADPKILRLSPQTLDEG